jgi:flagellar hook protein FlgE
LDAQGNIVVTADEEGAAELSLSISDSTGNTGTTDFDASEVLVTTEGKDGDTVITSVQIYNERGEARSLNAQFQKMDDTLANDVGDFIDNRVSGIEFFDDGSFRRINGTGIGDATIQIDFDSIDADQTISLSFDQVSHTPSDFGTFFEQDGFPTGFLKAVGVSADGVLEGIATNGVRLPIAQLALASFANEQALLAEGNNLFSETLSSGQAQIGKGLSAGRGQVIGGNLEQSNVDIAYEFTQLIIAQRGFSANARTITVTDHVLEELTNIVR